MFCKMKSVEFVLSQFLIYVGLSVAIVTVSAVADNSVQRNEDGDGDSGPACSASPKISIVSYFRDGFKPNATFPTELVKVPSSSENGSGTVILSPFEAAIVIECEATVPIEWNFDDPNGPPVDSVVISREDADPLKPDPCFRITISLITSNVATGKYWCRTIGNSKPSSWLYLYGNGNGPPFLLNNDKHITVIPNDTSSTVVLPCRVINPTLTPILFKGESKVVSIQNSVPYNPQIGFTLNLEAIPDAFDTYKCTQGDGSVTVHVKQPPVFRVTPAASSVTIYESQRINLTCEGKNKIGLQGLIDDSRVTVRKDETGLAAYNYSVTYDLRNVDSDITCVDLKSTAKFHEWKVTSISEETERKSGISYDGDSHRFICYSKTKVPPVIALVECNSPIECQLADKCFSWNAPYKVKIDNGRPDCPASISRGSVCRGSIKNDLMGCAYVPNTISAGVVHCTLPNNGGRSRMYFFNGLSSGANFVFSDWHQAPIPEVANIESLEPNRNRTFYTGEIIPFQCSAQKFLFAHGIRFMFRLENGSYAQPEVAEYSRFGEPESSSLVIATSMLLISDVSIREVVCFVPFWNTTEWLNVSMPITVIESTEPKILMPEQRDILPFVVGSEQSVRCEAEGIPAPRVVWYHRGRKVENQGEVADADSPKHRRNSVIYFGHVDEDDEGIYICNASNVYGSQARNFTLNIAPGTKKTLHTAIVLGILTFLVFFITVAVLCKKLKKKEQIIAKLSEKEIREFREGDTVALRSAPDGYIRAQYLPYDKEYEILQENLKIEEEIILGKGEYGIVMKGTLRQNDCLKEVAVKTIRGTDVNHFKALLSELKILTYIGWHDNVINLLGAVTRNLRDRDVYVVVEYCRLGDLESFLRNNKNSYLNQIVGDKIDLNLTFNFNAMQPYQTMHYSMSTTDLISWAYQIASGMEYLANKKVIHGDLAPRNILLTEDRTIKITDFGLSKHLYNDCSNYISHATMDLPWKLCAPEVLQYNSIFSTHSDEWAFGVTLWEMFSLGETPYQGIPFTWDFKTRLLQGYRLDKPVYSNQAIYNQILHCWKNVPAERISFMELRKYFHWLLHHWAEEPKPVFQTANGNTPDPLNYLQIEQRPYAQMHIEA